MQLVSFLALPILCHKFSFAYLGGGFVSIKPRPGDIDLVLETVDPYGPEAFAAVSPFFVIGLDAIESTYGVDLHFWMRNAPSGLSDYRYFFQYDKRRCATHMLSPSRGIVQINLTSPAMLGQLRRHIRGEIGDTPSAKTQKRKSG